NASQARLRADTLAERLRTRMARLESKKRIVPLPPTIVGGALVVPVGWFTKAADIEKISARVAEEPPSYGTPSKEVELLAMQAVMEAERRHGFTPTDVSSENRGYDIESLDPQTGNLRFIEVKGRIAGATSVSLTRNEVLTALNKPESWYLAVVFVENRQGGEPRYFREPFRDGLQFAAASVVLPLDKINSVESA
ncbi:MAG: DUF3883 domain-containing protein, partial [Caulobacterales bacterium]